MLHGLGMPVFLDRAYPYHDRYANGPSIPGLMNREFDVQKHWWGYKLTELGFQVACTSGWAARLWFSVCKRVRVNLVFSAAQPTVILPSICRPRRRRRGDAGLFQSL